MHRDQSACLNPRTLGRPVRRGVLNATFSDVRKGSRILVWRRTEANIAPSALASVIEPATEPPSPSPLTPALPAASIDTEALEARRAEEPSKDEALTLASARREREVARVALLRQKLKRDPGLFKDAATLGELRRAAEDPLTAPDALSAMAEAPGPLSADLLYEMWTGTVVRNSATELARSLVFSKEVRAKASPELAVALDLRIAETCEQNQALLPRVNEKGDRRSLALLAKLAPDGVPGAIEVEWGPPKNRAGKAQDLIRRLVWDGKRRTVMHNTAMREVMANANRSSFVRVEPGEERPGKPQDDVRSGRLPQLQR